MKFTYVYVIQSVNTRKLYKGSTDNLINRLKEHNAGKNESTKPYRPYKLIYYEAFLNKADALAQEKYLKSGSGRELIRQKLENYLKSQ